MGTLSVFTTSGTAEVWIDGVPRGAAPVSVEVPVGRHLVRVWKDGYRAFGTTVEVKRGLEAPVQAGLKPTKGFAKLDDLMRRVQKNADASTFVVDIARHLKVDRVLMMAVEQKTGSVQIVGTIVDGVAGKKIVSDQKSVSQAGDFFERDVQRFVEQLWKDHDQKMKDGVGAGNGIDGERRRSLLPGDVERAEVPSGVVTGWVLVGLSALPLAAGITAGIITLGQKEAFLSRTQVASDLPNVKQAWMLTSIGADAGYVVAAGMVGLGVYFLIDGYDEWDKREAVLGARPQ
jgi:hypothetical protein